jgi:hypothetical protein
MKGFEVEEDNGFLLMEVFGMQEVPKAGCLLAQRFDSLLKMSWYLFCSIKSHSSIFCTHSIQSLSVGSLYNASIAHSD